MQQLTLSSEQVKKLEDHILELQAKYAIPLLQLISGFIAENSKPKEAEIVED